MMELLVLASGSVQGRHCNRNPKSIPETSGPAFGVLPCCLPLGEEQVLQVTGDVEAPMSHAKFEI